MSQARFEVFPAAKIQVFLGCNDVMYCDRIPTFRRIKLHPSSGWIWRQHGPLKLSTTTLYGVTTQKNLICIARYMLNNVHCEKSLALRACRGRNTRTYKVVIYVCIDEGGLYVRMHQQVMSYAN